MATWFDSARFGMFIHWGLSSVRGWELSWPMVGATPALPHCQSVSIDEYYASAKSFVPANYRPREWARLAARLGMQYATFTAKHHDGFAMFDTKLSDFSIVHTRCRRDVLREFIDAFRAEGLRIGVYFSLSDWHHPDYPAFVEADKPYDFFRLRQPTPEQWARYIDFLFGQVRELLTHYGPVDLIWFDGQWERVPSDRWRPAELRAMIKALQPGILINDRLPECGDFDTPEQFIPPQPLWRAWETCMTINESWGYNPSDTHHKSPRQLIHALCEVAGKGGNLLLNVSPMGDGTLPPEQVERLEVVAQWMAVHGESIVGTTPGLEPWQFYGPSTRKGDRLFLHLLMKPYETVSVRGVPIKRTGAVRVLASGAALQHSTRCSIVDSLFNADPLGELTIVVPESVVDPYATVIAVDVPPPSCHAVG
jgi:alpha-L-fucosidase